MQDFLVNQNLPLFSPTCIARKKFDLSKFPAYPSRSNIFLPLEHIHPTQRTNFFEIQTIEYGNNDMIRGTVVPQFWLDEKLEITIT